MSERARAPAPRRCSLLGPFYPAVLTLATPRKHTRRRRKSPEGAGHAQVWVVLVGQRSRWGGALSKELLETVTSSGGGQPNPIAAPPPTLSLLTHTHAQGHLRHRHLRRRLRRLLPLLRQRRRRRRSRRRGQDGRVHPGVRRLRALPLAAPLPHPRLPGGRHGPVPAGRGGWGWGWGWGCGGGGAAAATAAPPSTATTTAATPAPAPLGPAAAAALAGNLEVSSRPCPSCATCASRRSPARGR